jgi:hypothetical protein
VEACAVLNYWLSVFIKTFSDSVAFINQSKTGIWFAILVLVLTAIWLFKKHGWREAMKHWARTAGEGVVITVVAFVIVCMFHFLFEPYHLDEDMRARLLQAENATQAISVTLQQCNFSLSLDEQKNGLLQQNVTSQSSLINSQQSMLNSQQTSVNTCVTTLTQVTTIKQETTGMSRRIDLDALRSNGRFITLLTLLTNKVVAPVSFLVSCDMKVNSFYIMPADGSATHIQSADKVDDRTGLVTLNEPSWSPKRPVFIVVYHDDPKLSVCSTKLRS